MRREDLTQDARWVRIVDRVQLIKDMLAARTPDELERVHALASCWLATHPDDFEVLFAGEQVTKMMSAVQSISSGGSHQEDEVTKNASYI